RDTAPHGGEGYLLALEEKMKTLGVGKIATVVGRYYAMDRDKRWERTQRAYDLITMGQGFIAESAVEAIRRSYEAGVTDEFLEPVRIGGGPAGITPDGGFLVV